MRIHLYLFNKVQKSHSKKGTTASSNRSNWCKIMLKISVTISRRITCVLNSFVLGSLWKILGKYKVEFWGREYFLE